MTIRRLVHDIKGKADHSSSCKNNNILFLFFPLSLTCITSEMQHFRLYVLLNNFRQRFRTTSRYNCNFFLFFFFFLHSITEAVKIQNMFTDLTCLLFRATAFLHFCLLHHSNLEFSLIFVVLYWKCFRTCIPGNHGEKP